MRTKIVNDDNYYVVQAWMVMKLKLKGLEKDIFAIIYGYSQDTESDFHGSLAYLSQITGYTQNRICDTLKYLTEQNYVIKTEIKEGAIKRCSYVANPDIIKTHSHPKDLDGSQSSHPKDLDGSHPKDLDGIAEKMQESHPKDLDVNIIHNKNTKNIKIKIKRNTSQKPNLINSTLYAKQEAQALELAQIYNETCTNLSKVRLLDAAKITAIDNLLKVYSVEDFKEGCTIINETPFTLGENDRGWKATFVFIINTKNLTKVLEGKYGSVKKTNRRSGINDLACNRNVKFSKITPEEEKEAKELLEQLKRKGEKYEF